MKGTFHRYSTGKKIKVILAHAFLAVLAVVWLLPVLWVNLTSFRGTKGSYSSTFFPTRYTLDNYIKLFTDFSVFNFPKVVMEYIYHSIGKLYHIHIFCDFGGIYSFKTAVPCKETVNECSYDYPSVSGIYVDDRGILHY